MKYLVIVALFLGVVVPAHAYIDAGSGSYVIQIAMASALAIAFSIKMFWQRIKSAAVKLFGGSDKPKVQP